MPKNKYEEKSLNDLRSHVSERPDKLCPKIKWVDLGGAYVGPTQNRILRLAKELGVKTYLVNDIESQVHYRRGKRLYVPPGSTTTWNPFLYMDLNSLMRKVDEIGKTIPLDAPWDAPRAMELDRTSAQEFADRFCWTSAAKEYWKLFVNLNVCCEPYEASMLWFCWYVRACGGVDRIISTTNGGQERKFDGGTQQIPEKIAKILGDRVKLKSPIASIFQDEKCVKVQTVSGQTYQADYVILAIPPILQLKIHFTPELPPKRNQMIQRIPMGSVIKCMVYYKTPFWRDHGLSGSMQMVESGDEFPICYTLDDTKPDGSCPCIIGFISSDKARNLADLTPQERLGYIAESYAKASGLDEFRRPIHYEEKNWMNEQYSGGCYVGHFPPGCLTTFGPSLLQDEEKRGCRFKSAAATCDMGGKSPEFPTRSLSAALAKARKLVVEEAANIERMLLLRQPHGRLYFAGTETATRWSGYMEGAVEAGERSAKEILSELGHIAVSDIWTDEPPSEESTLTVNFIRIYEFIQGKLTGLDHEKYLKVYVLQDYEGMEKTVASEAVLRYNIELEDDAAVLPLPENGGYHRDCYQRYTRKSTTPTRINPQELNFSKLANTWMTPCHLI
ncbi:Amine oxidase [flavin-containing] [Nymphon striatum]|nr:Amine oxidase [flavin-containing] [Nymphon striatum]